MSDDNDSEFDCAPVRAATCKSVSVPSFSAFSVLADFCELSCVRSRMSCVCHMKVETCADMNDTGNCEFLQLPYTTRGVEYRTVQL